LNLCSQGLRVSNPMADKCQHWHCLPNPLL
jgi:hypothetical protein